MICVFEKVSIQYKFIGERGTMLLFNYLAQKMGMCEMKLTVPISEILCRI